MSEQSLGWRKATSHCRVITEGHNLYRYDQRQDVNIDQHGPKAQAPTYVVSHQFSAHLHRRKGGRVVQDEDHLIEQNERIFEMD